MVFQIISKQLIFIINVDLRLSDQRRKIMKIYFTCKKKKYWRVWDE